MYAHFISLKQRRPTMTPFLRMLHRWTSAVFVLCVIATSLALAQPKPAMWMSYLPLAPLAVLSLTGVWMFVAHYRARGRA